MINRDNHEFEIDSVDLQPIIGPNDQTLRLLEKRFNVDLNLRGNRLVIQGEAKEADKVKAKILKLVNAFEQDPTLDLKRITEIINHGDFIDQSRPLTYTFDGKQIFPKTKGQAAFIEVMKNHALTFAIGPAGTGKTFLAVAYGVHLFRKNEIKRIVLTRPAVEAGESLGFLPGDLREKVDPYLQPLYDALYILLGTETVDKMIEKKQIEIAPLAYMRGRTLDDAIVILDEAQNTTSSQMKMFLTRLGFHSKMIVTGDITQIDLKVNQRSGLLDAQHRLNDIDDIGFIHLRLADIVRHPLVSKILSKYEDKDQ